MSHANSEPQNRGFLTVVARRGTPPTVSCKYQCAVVAGHGPNRRAQDPTAVPCRIMGSSASRYPLTMTGAPTKNAASAAASPTAPSMGSLFIAAADASAFARVFRARR